MVFRYTGCQPDGQIGGDSDISGIGVLTSFIVTAWITVFTATIALLGQWTPVYRKSMTLIHLSIIAEELLGFLCDLQALTGAGIVIAGLSQRKTITFYHMEIVNNCWLLTMNSLWACRQSYVDAPIEKLAKTWSRSRVLVRRCLIVVSVCLGVAHLTVAIVVQKKDDESDARKCYNYNDVSYHPMAEPFWWIMIAGLCIYGIVLVIRILNIKALLAFSYNGTYDKVLEFFSTRMRDKDRDDELSNATTTARKTVAYARRLMSKFYRLLMRLAFTVLWFLRFLIVIWTYGEGTSNMILYLYYGFCAWNTYDIGMLLLMNQHLFLKEDVKMGYGQVLPLCILATIPMNALDIWKNPKKKKQRRFVALSMYMRAVAAEARSQDEVELV